jgi:hypothetical protein
MPGKIFIKNSKNELYRRKKIGGEQMKRNENFSPHEELNL